MFTAYVKKMFLKRSITPGSTSCRMLRASCTSREIHYFCPNFEPGRNVTGLAE